MTTNDPLKPYPGNLKRHEVKPNEHPKRDPLLSDKKLTGRDHGPEPDRFMNDGRDWLNWWGRMNDTPNMDAWDVRDFYERLIDEGRLRVVEQVTHEERGGFVYCSGCDWSAPWEIGGMSPNMKCCPGCGNKIKR